MVHSTYRFALLTFNLLCSIEAMKESFVGGDSMVDAYGAEDKGQKLQVSLGEHDTGHGETENEANGEGVAFVEVTASGALTTIARPRNSSLVEAVQADEAELAGEAEQDEDAEEADEVDGAKLTGEAENAKEAENDQPDDLFTAAQANGKKQCFDCISHNFVFCKDAGKEHCHPTDPAGCIFKVKKDGVHLHLPSTQVTLPEVTKTYSISEVALGQSSIVKDITVGEVPPRATLPSSMFGECGALVGKTLTNCANVGDKCPKKSCDLFCRARYNKYCEQKREVVGAQTKTGFVCAEEKSKCRKCIDQSTNHVFCKDAGDNHDKCFDTKEQAKEAGCNGLVTVMAMRSTRSKQYRDYPDCHEGATR